MSSPGLAQSKSDSAIVVQKRILQDTLAFNKTVQKSPEWSMTSRDSCVDETRARIKTEYGPDVTKQLDWSKARSPTWTLKSRWKDQPAKGSWVPGPGHYPGNSTLGKTHPTLPVSGRGWSWGSEERKTLGTGDQGVPPPGSYDPQLTQTKERVRHTTVRGRNELHKEVQPVPNTKPGGVWGQGAGLAETQAPRTVRDVTGMTVKGGTTWSPSWTFNGRPQSMLVPGGMPVPGPGKVSPELSSYGRIKRSPSYGFGSSSRWPKEQDPRPY